MEIQAARTTQSSRSTFRGSGNAGINNGVISNAASGGRGNFAIQGSGDGISQSDGRVRTYSFAEHPAVAERAARGRQQRPRRQIDHCGNCCTATMVILGTVGALAMLFPEVGLPLLGHYGKLGGEAPSAESADEAAYLLAVRNTPPGAPLPVRPVPSSSTASRSAPSSASRSSTPSSSSSSSKGRRLNDIEHPQAGRAAVAGDLFARDAADAIRKAKKAQFDAAAFEGRRAHGQAPQKSYSHNRKIGFHFR